MLIEVTWQNLIISSHGRENASSGPFFPLLGHQIYYRGSTPTTSSKSLITCQQPHLQIPPHWRLGLQYKNLGRTQTFSLWQWPCDGQLRHAFAFWGRMKFRSRIFYFGWCKGETEGLFWNNPSRWHSENSAMATQFVVICEMAWVKENTEQVGQRPGFVLLRCVLFCSSSTCHSQEVRYLQRYCEILRSKGHLLMH